MEKNKDLELIKKHYGEKFMHLCRILFPTILEQEGLLFKTINNTIAPTKQIYDDVINDVETFKDYINLKAGIKTNEKYMLDTGKTPYELLRQAGYLLFPECKTEEDIQSFKKYYEKNERLCTFKGGRLDLCRVWFAVKQNVENIKRENFPNPKRQDEYGTSVISIQFTRGDVSELSIKNRYNHTVKNPDATFSNNLENIIPGLTKAFEKTYNIKLNPLALSNFLDLKKYVTDDFGRYYRIVCYSLDTRFVPYYFCENNILILNGKVTQFDKNRYILMGQYLVDLSQKSITNVMEDEYFDSFLVSLGQIKDIKLEKNQQGCKVLVLKVADGEDVKLTLDKFDQLVEYYNPNITTIYDEFLVYDKFLQKFSAPKLIKIGDEFLLTNETLSVFDAPKLERVGEYCLKSNKEIVELSLPSLKKMGERFMANNIKARNINLPKLKFMPEYCFECNKNAEIINIPSVEFMDDCCFLENKKLHTINVDSLTGMGDKCFQNNNSLKTFSAPKLLSIGNLSFHKNTVMTKFYAPKLRKHGKDVLCNNENIELPCKRFLFF